EGQALSQQPPHDDDDPAFAHREDDAQEGPDDDRRQGGLRHDLADQLLRQKFFQYARNEGAEDDERHRLPDDRRAEPHEALDFGDGHADHLGLYASYATGGGRVPSSAGPGAGQHPGVPSPGAWTWPARAIRLRRAAYGMVRKNHATAASTTAPAGRG